MPSLRLSVEQRYTCLEDLAAEGRFRYGSLASGFMADLTVDQYGLVLDYASLFRRVWPV